MRDGEWAAGRAIQLKCKEEKAPVDGVAHYFIGRTALAARARRIGPATTNAEAAAPAANIRITASHDPVTAAAAAAAGPASTEPTALPV